MNLNERIAALITPTLEGMGYGLVRVLVMGSKKSPTLQIMAERADGEQITVDDCATISHTVSAQLDVADPITSAYTLEVSSPGIDRPLTRLKDFSRFAGLETKIQLREPQDGRRNFAGILRGVAEEDAVLLELPPAAKGAAPETVRFKFAAIDTARLVMNDALLKAAETNKGLA